MHEGAARRLHELTMAILDEAEVNERGYVDIRIGNMYRMLETLGEFVAKSMGEWVEHDNAAFYAYLSIRNVLRNAGYAGPKQILRDITTKEQRAKLAQVARNAVADRIDIDLHGSHPRKCRALRRG